MEIRQECCEEILNLSEAESMEDRLQDILQNVIEDSRQKTLKYQLKDWINRVGYAHCGQTYWQYMRNLFIEIIVHNICKASRIQNNQYEMEVGQYKECFGGLDLTGILNAQNTFSRNETTGFIWVLNTCIFVIADYNFALVQQNF